MSWKHRNILGILLLLAASLLWVWGKGNVTESHNFSEETTAVMAIETSTAIPVAEPTEETTSISTDSELAYTESVTEMIPSTVVVVDDMPYSPTNTYEELDGRSGNKAFGIAVCVIGTIMGILGIFVLPQKKAVLGPDGIAALWFLGGWWYGYMLYTVGNFREFFLIRVVAIFLPLLTLRILWGWCLCRFSLKQCLLRRVASHLPGEGWTLLLFLGWFILAATGLCVYRVVYFKPHHWMVFSAGMVTGGFGLLFLLKYTMELQHLRKQLDSYRQGLPIEVKEGAFAQTEEQLLLIRREHEEAVKTAVVGERFKVDLIANVSHDLRTPLTSILGYSELLEKEELSPKGKEQLARLHEKSVYMNELVESLFELTKVESGALEPKREQIDLVRLLEQTIGFFDDRLQETSLEIRRHYGVEHSQITSDGGMLHRVFANLLGNALKYALPCTRIYLELKEETEIVCIRMVNTANYEMDFSEEEILERFARGDKARSTQGSGIGLAIAKTYTEAVGGTFRIRVDGDQFSAFVTLPKN